MEAAMETTTRLLLPEVREALASEPQELAALTEEMHPADLADLVRELQPGEAQQLLAVLPPDFSARVLEMCDEETRARLFGEVAKHDVAEAIEITDAMAADDRADLYADLPDELRKQLLDAIPSEESQDIRQLLAYPEGTAGALMTTEFVALSAHTTAAQSIDEVRRVATEMETIYSAYAINDNGTLLGVVSLRDLVVSPASRRIEELMEPNVITIDVDAEQAEAARLIAKYDLLALPVVDRNHQLLGIITVDDVIDVVQDEATEDVHRMGAVEPLEQPYMMTPPLELVRKRAPWLIALFIGGTLTPSVLEHYSTTLAAAAVLMWFVPLIVSAGGNAGSQSATLIIRAMALGRVEPREVAVILRRELIVGFLLGVVLAAVGMLRVLATSSTRDLHIVLIISMSLIAVVTLAAMVGSGLPLLLKRLGLDPAVASTPFIASAMDVTGMFLYFEIARAIL
ncbi:MAG TPA: magnesium transporter [Kofleriaceae bacterium]|nr:magnesium transporter [Kofleriaceae bacterium]